MHKSTIIILCFGFILLLVSINRNSYEGFNVSNLQPDNTQFKVMGSTDYKPVINTVNSAYDGFYTSLLKLTNNRNLSQHYTSPISEEKVSKEPNNYFNDNKVIDHDSNKWKPPIDPFATHAHPVHQYGILYPVDKQDTFLEEYDKHIHEILKRKQITEQVSM